MGVWLIELISEVGVQSCSQDDETLANVAMGGLLYELKGLDNAYLHGRQDQHAQEGARPGQMAGEPHPHGETHHVDRGVHLDKRILPSGQVLLPLPPRTTESQGFADQDPCTSLVRLMLPCINCTWWLMGIGSYCIYMCTA